MLMCERIKSEKDIELLMIRNTCPLYNNRAAQSWEGKNS